jgi:hypothetical protein
MGWHQLWNDLYSVLRALADMALHSTTLAGVPLDIKA